MSTLATTNIATQRTVTATNVAISRGARLTLDSSGTVSVSAIGVRGDFIALQAIPASEKGLAAPIGAGGSVPVIASETTAVGDAAYSAASGKVSKTSTNAVLMGKWLQIGTANALAIIELESVA
jgi:hypothetical protein